MRSASIILLCALTTSLGASPAPGAQTNATIESEGLGTVEAAPDYVEFWVHHRVGGKSVAEAAQESIAFEPALRKELETHQLTPLSLAVSGLAVPAAEALETKRSARLRFSTAPFANGDEGSKLLAKLCDEVLAVAAAVHGTVEGPALGMDNTKPIEQAAVSMATERAYPLAEAVATAMKTQIYGIDHASVVSVVWNRDPESRAPQPEIHRLTCTARVKIVYLYPSGQN